jgi:hypothetical protein
MTYPNDKKKKERKGTRKTDDKRWPAKIEGRDGG